MFDRQVLYRMQFIKLVSINESLNDMDFVKPCAKNQSPDKVRDWNVDLFLS